jgi:hypothetical protein
MIRSIHPDMKLMSSGMIQPFSLASLLAFIEKEFGKKITPPKITAQSFDTARVMVSMGSTGQVTSRKMGIRISASPYNVIVPESNPFFCDRF